MPNIPRERANRKLFPSVSNTSDKASKVKTDSRLFVSTTKKGCPYCVVTQGHNRLTVLCLWFAACTSASRSNDAAQTSNNSERTCMSDRIGFVLFSFLLLLLVVVVFRHFASRLFVVAVFQKKDLDWLLELQYSVLLTTASYGPCP